MTGRLLDASTGAPVRDGIVTVGNRETKLGADGLFQIPASAGRIQLRAPGYSRGSVSVADLVSAGGRVTLAPFTPHALYLSANGVGSSKLMAGVMAIVAGGGANALVIDLKGDRGTASWPAKAKLATVARKPPIADLANLTRKLHTAGIYVIARIVVFKDSPLAQARPEFAAHLGKKLFKDREGANWTDPFEADVRDYNIDLAVEAAQAGVDEIQFDYLRFPDSSARLAFSQPTSSNARVAAITGFLAEARARLTPYNVFTAADIFGYVCWNSDDTGIGQRLEEVAGEVDYLSPMLYPSGFKFGIPGVRDPVADPYAIIHESLVRAQRRLGISPKRLRPWLQAFKDYAFDRRAFGAVEVALQVRAADDAGADGWMLWNASNKYGDTGLVPPT